MYLYFEWIDIVPSQPFCSAGSVSALDELSSMSVLFSALLPGSDFCHPKCSAVAGRHSFWLEEGLKGAMPSHIELQLSVGELRNDFQSMIAWLLLLSAESEQLVTARVGLKPKRFTTGSRRQGC